MQNRTESAFSLLELLISVGIVLILMGLGAVAFQNVARSFSIGAAGQQVRSAIQVASQEATARNRPVEMRLCRPPNSTDPTIVYFVIHESDGTLRPLQRPLALPDDVVIDETLSTLLAGKSFQAGGPNAGGVGSLGTNYEYAGVFLLPGGITSIAPTNTNAQLLIIRSKSDVADPPGNFTAVQLDPVTSRTLLHRP